MCSGPRHGGPTTSAVSGGEQEGEEGPQLDDLWPRAGNHEPRLTAAMDEAGGPLSSLSLTWFMSVLEHFLGAPSSAQLLTCVCFLFIWCVPLQKKNAIWVKVLWVHPVQYPVISELRRFLNVNLCIFWCTFYFTKQYFSVFHVQAKHPCEGGIQVFQFSIFILS